MQLIMSIIPFSGLISTSQHSLSSSSSNSLVGGSMAFLQAKISSLSLTKLPSEGKIIRMGGGPRTYPGGVTKWQWKRMQASKAKQLLKARLARERQIYEMRKRAELKAAVSELERPWETVEKAPTLFSSSADEQLKVLADRFQKPGGFDLWSERDGPQLFRPDNGLPSTRFFPKGVVHSRKPYDVTGKIDCKSSESGSLSSEEDLLVMSETDESMRAPRKRNIGNSTVRSGSSFDEGRNMSDYLLNSLEDVPQERKNGQKGDRRKFSSNSNVGFHQKNDGNRLKSGYKADDSYSGVKNLGNFGSTTLEDVPEESQVGKLAMGGRGKGDVRRNLLSASKGGLDKVNNRNKSRPGHSVEDSYSGAYSSSDFVSRTSEDVAKGGSRGQLTEGRNRKRGLGRKSFSRSDVGFDGKVNRNNNVFGFSSEDSSSRIYNMSAHNDGSYGFEIDI